MIASFFRTRMSPNDSRPRSRFRHPAYRCGHQRPRPHDGLSPRDLRAARARAFGEWLGGVSGRPVIYFDERYTTVEAENRLIDLGMTRQKRKALRDKLAAQIMLQSYLEAGCPETEAAGVPLADPDEVEL